MACLYPPNSPKLRCGWVRIRSGLARYYRGRRRIPAERADVENPSRFLRPDRTSDWFPSFTKILRLTPPVHSQVGTLLPNRPSPASRTRQARGNAIDAPLPQLQGPLLQAETVIAGARCACFTGVPVEHSRPWPPHSVPAWLAERAELQPQATSDRDYPACPRRPPPPQYSTW